MLDVGYVVSDIYLTGSKRGSYKVWVPKKHGDPIGLVDYNGFGINIGNLGAGDVMLVKNLAEYYYPIMPLSSGGHPPFNPNNGMVSVQENPTTIDEKNCPSFSNGEFGPVETRLGTVGVGRNYYMRHTGGADSLMQTYSPGSVSGYDANTHLNSEKGSYCRLSLGTKVVVCDYFIIGQLLLTQNNLMKEMPTLNQF